MNFLQGLFGGSKPPTDKQIASQVALLQRRHGEPAIRYGAADKLRDWAVAGSAPAIDGLLKRFSVNVASETSDEEEKAYVAEILTDKVGLAAVGPIEAYLRHEEQVSWPLRLLSKLVPPDEYRDRVVAILASFDAHYDRMPERKGETIHNLMDHASHPEVVAAVTRFLDDTDDAVRLAAIELLARSGRPEDLAVLATSLVESADRPRVRNALLQALDGKPAAGAGRRAEIEPLLPEGWYLTREGTVRRLAAR
jgi:HEAT repeat protein